LSVWRDAHKTNRKLVTKRKDLRLQGGTGSKTGGHQSEKSDEKRAHRGIHDDLTNDQTSVFSDGTEFSVTTGLWSTRATDP